MGISSSQKQCLSADDEQYLRKLYDLRYSCSDFGSEETDCQCKREKAKKLTLSYYKHKVKNERKTYQNSNETNMYFKVSTPNEDDNYVDYLSGKLVSTKPSHGYFRKVPLKKIRDPTCNELKYAVSNQCKIESAMSTDNKDIQYTMGLFCGMGTTWSPKWQQCIIAPDELPTIQGSLRPYQESIYPEIRPVGYRTPFDEPGRVYVDQEAETLGPGRSSGSLSGSGTCSVNYPGGKCSASFIGRCRFPLTSSQGQKQARLYVKLFREVYEYRGEEKRKIDLRLQIRELIDKHGDNWKKGIHGDGIFLPWHRWYILEMETILLQGQDAGLISGGCNNTFVGIPYFDWHNLRSSQTPRKFINSHIFQDSLGDTAVRDQGGGCIKSGALKNFQMTDGSNCVQRYWKDQMFSEGRSKSLIFTRELSKVLHLKNPFNYQYDQFRESLEFGDGLHGDVHRMVSGTMNTEAAANDPIFFTHHANVDKIWGDWQKQGFEHRDSFHSINVCGDKSCSWSEINKPMIASTASPVDMRDLKIQRYTVPLDGDKIRVSVEYVDFDTSSMEGKGHTLSIDLEAQEKEGEESFMELLRELEMWNF